MLNLSRGTAILLFLWLFPWFSAAASPLSVTINEIAWMGSEKSSYDEWIELFNESASPVSLEGWILKNDDGTLSIELDGVISPGGFYLLERTDDDSVPEVAADLIYKGTLKNSGEKLLLFDDQNNSADLVDCGGGWPAGDNRTKQTMEKSPSGNWQNSPKNGGSPKRENGEGEGEGESAPGPSDPRQEKKTYPSGIIINEILPSPKGNDSTEEWIEFFNENPYKVSLDGWSISDSAGKGTTYFFPKGTEVGSKNFIVLPRTESKIILNNDGDGLKLYNPEKETVSEVVFDKAPLGQSYSLLEGNWIWTEILTPGEENRSPAKVVESDNVNKTSDQGSKNLADIGSQIPEGNKTSFPVGISLFIASLSAAAVLTIKKLQQNKNLLQYP